MYVCCAGEPAVAPQLLGVLGSGIAAAHADGWVFGRWAGNFGVGVPILRD